LDVVNFTALYYLLCDHSSRISFDEKSSLLEFGTFSKIIDASQVGERLREGGGGVYVCQDLVPQFTKKQTIGFVSICVSKFECFRFPLKPPVRRCIAL